MPVPGPGDVLVKLACAPVNPADRMQIAGTYVDRREPPFTPGVTGVGWVVSAPKAGALGWYLKGKRVVFSPGPGREGTWADYAVAPAGLCLPLPKDLADADGVNLVANGMTALGLLERVKALRAPAVILTAAAGDVGRLFNRAASEAGVTVVNVVRGSRQKEALAATGVPHVVDGEGPDFATELASLAERLGARVAIDAVAGAMTGRLLAAMPDGAEVIVYGRLSGEPITFDGLEFLVGKHQRLSGFDIRAWLEAKSMPAVLTAARRAAALCRAGAGASAPRRVSLEELVSGFDELGRDQFAGKTLVYPHGSEPKP